MLIKMTKANLDKIILGTKTATSRTYYIPDGVHQLTEEIFVRLKGSYYSTITEMKDKNRYAIAEGFKDIHDMNNNCIFKHTKEFLSGLRGMYVYVIEEVIVEK